MLEIKQISAEDTYPIRHLVLRPNQTLEACKFDNDHQESSFHLGAFFNDTLISIASFYKEKHPNFDDKRQYRLRGMATLAEYRKVKAGSSLIVHAEDILTEELEADLWWCNARVTVSDFYKRLGLKEHGEVFEIESIGPHKLMYKIFK